MQKVVLALLVCANVALAHVRGGCATALSRPAPLGRVYYAMTRLVHPDGDFHSVRKLLPALARMDVRYLMISPLTSQIENLPPEILTPNDHGYWNAAHGDVSEKLGGVQGFQDLQREAHAQGLSIAVDIAANHFGYASEFSILGKSVSVLDPTWFKQAKGLVLEEAIDKWGALEILAGNSDAFFRRHAELTEFPLSGLPSLRHENRHVRDFLIQSYAKYVSQLGVELFRIDAAKHMQFDFLHEFTEGLLAEGRRSGKDVRFLFEMSFERPEALRLVVNELRRRSSAPNSLYFIDFPLVRAVRKLASPGHSFEESARVITARAEARDPVENFVALLENHDDEAPLATVFHAQLAHALTAFTSSGPVMLHHGLESSGPSRHGRQKIHGVSPTGDLAVLDRTVEACSLGELAVVQSTAKGLLLRRSAKGRDVYFAANTAEETVSMNLPTCGRPTPLLEKNVRFLGAIADNGTAVRLPPSSFVLWSCSPN